MPLGAGSWLCKRETRSPLELPRTGVGGGGPEMSCGCTACCRRGRPWRRSHPDLGIEAYDIGIIAVGAGGQVVADPVGRDAVQGAGVAVSAAGESVPVGASGGDRDRCGAAQGREGGRGAEPVGLSPAVRSSWAPTTGPTPLIAISAGFAAVARASIRVSRSATSSPSVRCRRAQGPQRVQGVGVVAFVDGLWSGTGKGGDQFGGSSQSRV